MWKAMSLFCSLALIAACQSRSPGSRNQRSAASSKAKTTAKTSKAAAPGPGWILAPHRDIKLPPAEHVVPLKRAPIVQISLPENDPKAGVVTLEGAEVATAVELLADGDWKIAGLITGLTERARTRKKTASQDRSTRRVIVQPDRKVDFKIIKKVMHSCSVAGYSAVHFAARGKSVGVIETSLREKGTKEAKSPTKTMGVVLIGEDGYVVTAGSQRTAISKVGQAYNTAKLATHLTGIRARLSDKEPLTIAVEDGVSYEHLVRALDIARSQGFAQTQVCDAGAVL